MFMRRAHIQTRTKNRPAYQYTRLGLYLLNFIFNLQWSLGMYFNANFLISRGLTESSVGIVYSLSAGLAAFLFLFIPRLIDGHMYRTFISSVLLASLGTFLLTVVHVPTTLALVFIVGNAIFYLTEYMLDLFLEAATPNENETGRVRAIFLTMANLAIALAPFLAGQILQEDHYSQLYLTMTALAAPLLILAWVTLRRFKTPPPEPIRWPRVFGKIIRDADLRGVFVAQFLLRFFFAVMVVYTPIYLHVDLGFSLTQIGIMFGIMLTPFLFIEIPLGRLADTRYGEKELLIAGIVITALSTALLSIFVIPSIVLWTALLFTTRIGASFIDIMSESYFFKHVDGSSASVIGAFRLLFPIAYIAAPALASFLLLSLPLQYLFAALGLFMLIGLPFIWGLKDTR